MTTTVESVLETHEESLDLNLPVISRKYGIRRQYWTEAHTNAATVTNAGTNKKLTMQISSKVSSCTLTFNK